MEESLLGLRADRVDPLYVRAGAKGGDREGLRLAAGEEARAVSAREEADLDRDRPDVLQAAAVHPDLLAQDQLAHGLLVDEGEEALADPRVASGGLQERLRIRAGAPKRPDRVGEIGRAHV